MDLFSEIKDLLVRELAIDETIVVPGAHLKDDLGADSLALLNIAENIASRYQIDLQVDDLMDIESFSGLVSLIQKKREEKQ